ncbi:MAG: S8 family serine peptidase [Planctomycetes bacterium]|nr:S8 family serine peptidase [Planctomycetota bacterium]MCC7398585.1 S8 family serine peptidase [Planctomycetota bacterium]
MRSTLLALCTAALGASAFAQALPTEAAPLTFEEATRRAGNARWLALKFASFDTTQAAPAIAEGLRAAPLDADAVDYFLVQVAGVDEPAKQALRAHGLELLDYVPNHAWIVRGSARQVAAAVDGGHAVWSSPLHPAYRVDPQLLLAGDGERRVVVMGFAGIEAATIAAQVAAAGASIVEQYDLYGRQLLLVSGRGAFVTALAKSHDVQWVDPESIATERNESMTWAIQTGQNGNRKLWSLGLHGEGQVVGHMDSGIATSSCYFSDPVNPIGASHRKLVYRSGTGTGSHGTHTAGSAAGDAQPVTGSTANRGLAYLAKIAASSNYTTTGFASYATTHKNNGASVHTNSWGNDGTLAYDALCVSIDTFQWNNEFNQVLFAETNTSTLRNPENAKNLVAVGNSGNGTSVNTVCTGGVGPTQDGRRKPDLFAPGCSIVSSGTSSCSTTTMTGTSMACPAATAATALIRQYFMDGFYPSGVANPADARTPTAALLKAVLINSGQDMTGVSGYPSNGEGWGHIVLDDALHFSGDGGRLWAVDVAKADGLATGQSRTMVVEVNGGSLPLEITMAFTDYPGTINAFNPVINDLDLRVTAPDGTVYRGNHFSGGWSVANGATVDAINNVERVAVQAPVAGTWTIEVIGTLVPQGPQGFAVAANGDIQNGFATAAVSTYGAGKAGSFGVPGISASLPLLPSTWNLHVADSMPFAIGLMLYGDSDIVVPFDGGTVLVNPLLILLVALDGNGELDFPVVLPPEPSLNGATTFWQAWIPLDPLATGDGWAATPGLRMTIGN